MASVRTADGREITVGNIYCIGRNVFAHALELGNPPPSAPLIFMKSTHALRSLRASGVAFPDETYHHEAELVVVLGSQVPHGCRGDWGAVQGVALGLDLTRRGVQGELKSAGHPWTRAKSFRGAAPVGPVVPLTRFSDPDHIEFQLTVEGELRQHGAVSELTFGIPDLLTRLAALGPLEPGDLVFTGTPAGVGPIRQGQAFELRFLEPDLRFGGVL